ncbi:hypothetical protein MPTK1_2g12420 [Marchantia polymorpha subsp. ruderalis]|uniref:Uncharacterized protein n=1 Tax=Marchantia polymorpha TaxID=3197 RepID=A0A2R6XAW4_MARPO|nr:hypothetical protein MARPO_0026s0129 [Marchantia polymorpha]BBN02060.1 hypothetical protein Mp_2g12420 [Marchantia polymorpha subsp. ruderalis]|eukprot:PTQ43261.1 hypothetical protein MARPO_0026s0129 [Marchantia polymorpha]
MQYSSGSARWQSTKTQPTRAQSSHEVTTGCVDTATLGCALPTCSSGALFVICRSDPAGNMEGQLPLLDFLSCGSKFQRRLEIQNHRVTPNFIFAEPADKESISLHSAQTHQMTKIEDK